MKRKIIIVGMDNTGKTTLVEDLSKKLNCNHFKSGGPTLSKEEMINDLTDKLEKEELLILERFSPFEELVYGNVLRNNSKFTLEEAKEILNEYDPIIIYCRPDNETIFNFGTREQMKGVIEEKEKLVKYWDELIGSLIDNYDIFLYDWKRIKSDDIISIINYVEEII